MTPLVIDGGNVGFDALLYQGTNNFDPNAFNSAVAGVIDRLDDVSKRFIHKAQQIYEHATSNTVALMARNAIQQASGALSLDTISVIPVSNLHNASPYMQRWIMAEPKLRDLYQKDRCDGYYGTYVDMFPGDIGESHYDWRRVMDGVVQYPEDKDEWLVQFFTEELLNENDELSSLDKTSILETWENVRLAIADGKDPSNPDGGDL